jgi:fibronectin-binding autotransporter adhesin
MTTLSILHALSRVLNQQVKQFRRTPLRKQRLRRPHLEVLDDRINPAGTILATFAAGGLVLTGDAGDNAFEITQGADDRLIIGGFPGTQIRLNGGPAQNAVILPAPVTTGVTVNLGAGADLLNVTGVDLPRLTINGGDGDNRYNFQSVAVRGSLSVTNGTGFDRTNLMGPVTVAGGLTIANGAGGSLVGDDPTTDLRVTRALTITNGAGADTVNLVNASWITAGRIVVNHGTGPGPNVTNFSPTQALTVGTAVRVTAGAGFDTVTLGGGTVAVGRGIVVNVGAGGSLIHVDPTARLSVGGMVSVTAAADFDSIEVGSAGVRTAVGGGVFANVGDGGSQILITGSQLTVGGPIRVSAGAGQDGVNLTSQAGDGVVGGGVTVSVGTGNNQAVSLVANTPGTSLAIGGALRIATAGNPPGPGGDFIQLMAVRVGLGASIVTGIGADIVMVNDSSFAGSFNLATNAGNDTIEIERLGTAGTTRFRGALRVSTGAGADVARVGNSAAGWNQAVFATTSMWDAGLGVGDAAEILGTGNLFFGTAPALTGFETVS